MDLLLWLCLAKCGRLSQMQRNQYRWRSPRGCSPEIRILEQRPMHNKNDLRTKTFGEKIEIMPPPFLAAVGLCCVQFSGAFSFILVSSVYKAVHYLLHASSKVHRISRYITYMTFFPWWVYFVLLSFGINNLPYILSCEWFCVKYIKHWRLTWNLLLVETKSITGSAFWEVTVAAHRSLQSIHRKKSFSIFPSPAGMSPNSP